MFTTWFRVAILAATCSWQVTGSEVLLEFRTPSRDDKPEAVESLLGSNVSDPVSLFYADEYVTGGSFNSFMKLSLSRLMRRYPCVLLEPALPLVRDTMTLYGTCDYQKMFRLKLTRSSGDRWTESAQLSEDGCVDEPMKKFFITWRGRNHSGFSKPTELRYLCSTFELLLYKAGWSYRKVRSLYPVNKTNWKLRPMFSVCDCFSGTDFKYQESWRLLCPEANHTMQTDTLLLGVILTCAGIIIGIVFAKKKLSVLLNQFWKK